jgi:hypothetical protein
MCVSRYPVTFAILVLPLSVVRFYGFHHTVPSWGEFFVKTIFNLNGLVDVILFFTTRQGLLLFNHRDNSTFEHPLSDDTDEPPFSI